MLGAGYQHRFYAAAQQRLRLPAHQRCTPNLKEPWGTRCEHPFRPRGPLPAAPAWSDGLRLYLGEPAAFGGFVDRIDGLGDGAGPLRFNQRRAVV